MMGFYERWIVPRLLDLAMRNRLLDHYRQRTIKTAQGLVLEVGVGSGLNLPLYGPTVTRVVAIDPSPELLRIASRRTADVVIPVSLLRASAEHVPFADAVFDTIVMTWTLCSIPNPIAALTEMRRVLRPGGQLLFVEHGLSSEIRDCSVAASLDAVLEADQRGLSPRSQDRRTDPRGGIPNRCDRNRLHEGTKTLDFHVSWFRDELILSAPGKARHIRMPDVRQLLPANDKGECREDSCQPVPVHNPLSFRRLADANSWRVQVPLGYRSLVHSPPSRRPRRRLITQSGSPPFRLSWLPTR